MRLFEQRAEILALKTACDGDEETRSKLLAKLGPDHFHHPELKAAVGLLFEAAQRDGDIPSAKMLVADPALEEGTRQFIRGKLSGVKAIKQSELSQLLKTLDKYRVARILATVSKHCVEKLGREKVNVDSLLNEVTEKLTEARLSAATSRKLYHIGKGNNSTAAFKRVLKGRTAKLIPTGFSEFDETNGGIAEESLWVLTANTGGLKSAMAKQILLNMYYAGHNVCYVSLEMSFEECIYRLFSNQTGIEATKFLKSILTKDEKRKALKAYEKMAKAGKKSGKRFTIFPVEEESIGIDEVLATVGPLGYKVIVLDYVTLLADADEDEQWKVLSRVARKAKKFAQKHKCVFVLLAQLSDDDKIRYSKGISEHANNWWRWRLTDKERETGIIQIIQAKARNQAAFPFELAVNFSTFTIGNMTDALLSLKRAKVTGDDVSMEEIGEERQSRRKRDIDYDV